MAAGVLGKAIIMVRGNSACFDVTPVYKNTDGTLTPYVPEEGDAITFVLKKQESDVNPLLELPVDLESMTLTLDPNDTENLPAGLIEGRYKYYVELEKANGWVDTFIHDANFILLEKG